MEEIGAWVAGFAGTLAVYPIAAVVNAIAGIVPPVPSTALFVGLGALNATSGEPSFLGLVLAMIAGSIAGDLILYALASRFDFRQWPLLSSPRAQRRLERIDARMESESLQVLVISRFIPLGRTAVSLIAGAGRMSLRDFTGALTTASVVWALYSVGFGWLTARWIPVPTIVAVIIAIVLSIVLGFAISRLGDWWIERRAED
ncbi:VTT domain-containing protein [Nocardia zapadnayensis]|uniref:DedA family protein n=1 Tax=Brevibacterium sp. R8603A2 TaxID=2929779 RepID=UPI001FF826CE|nr:VTT domain-containing protein [Nocardia zapadnayensis]MCK1803134.1 VTT domain-containing protein [Brevibacterium sp. R8603A2]MCX0277172.1 VTT domain-containing protein [Nocardia zapadnayensis]